jgi:hypothetical protein
MPGRTLRVVRIVVMLGLWGLVIYMLATGRR